jgi:hypothetical protein
MSFATCGKVEEEEEKVEGAQKKEGGGRGAPQIDWRGTERWRESVKRDEMCMERWK